jgi:hypothetical protein
MSRNPPFNGGFLVLNVVQNTAQKVKQFYTQKPIFLLQKLLKFRKISYKKYSVLRF